MLYIIDGVFLEIARSSCEKNPVSQRDLQARLTNYDVA